MLDALQEHFSSQLFMPHGHCYLWKPGLVWLQAGSNALIGLAYVAIALTLAYLVKRGQYVPFKGMALAFGTFIITCGLTHFFDVYVIWHPVYWLDGGVRAVTAVASVGTALLLPPLIPKAIALARGAKAAQERGVELEVAVRDLGTMYERTRELEQLKTQFFANVSHELRTPLALITGPAEKLRSSSNLNEEQKHDLEVISRNARTLLKHVNDLLDVSRLESGKARVEYSEVDLSTLVRTAAGNFDGVAADRGMQFRVDGPETLSAELDYEHVQRIVLNLFSNAFKFTPPGGTVRCSLAADTIDGRECAILEVADSGPGVRPEERELIFERFAQVEGGPTRPFGGTGLGLAIARDFARALRGRIAVAAAPEGGALFRVELPRRAPEGVPVRAPVGSAKADEEARQVVDELSARVQVMQPTEGGERPLVLVVEDNPDMNRFICGALAPDFRTESAFDGREGHARALELRPDLVLTDLMMPRMSGDELLRELRSERRMEAVPILLLTAKADDELRAQLLREGAQDYVMKPFPVEELRARVTNLVTMKRARDVLQKELASQSRDLETLAKDMTLRKRELHVAVESMRVAREQAERASHLKSDFLSIVSHELRTPLASLRLQIERIQIEERLPDQTRNVVRRMMAQSSRLEELIEGILEYARSESGRVAAEPESFDLEALVTECVEQLRPQAENKGLEIGVEVAADLPPLRSDPRLVRLIAVNLLGNSVKFTASGSVTLALDHDGKGHHLRVTDTGPGIPPEQRRRIFEPFAQGESPRRKHLAGIGLGLALVRELADSLGGSILVDSEVGRGTTFAVVLPPMVEREVVEPRHHA